MRTLLEIIETTKDGETPAPDETYWAMLALSALSAFDSQDFHRLLYKGTNDILTPQVLGESRHQRWKAALGKSPKEWVGWNNDPSNPDYQKFRTMAFGLLDKVEKEATGHET